MTDDQRPILILGAGINGAALARELILNGIPVTVVDTGDLAGGTTAYSSRLIHGGLRYLEYGEFSLVRESLAERGRLLRLAPQFVKPLRFHIPVKSRFSGWKASAGRFLGFSVRSPGPRGLWMVRMGLAFYDLIAREGSLPPSGCRSLRRAGDLRLNEVFRWICSYSDAQIVFPERFVAALLEDARQSSQRSGVGFELHTYHQAEFSQGVVHISFAGERVRSFRPAAVFNATGAWIDQTLGQLKISSRRLMGGTKGTHLLVDSPALADQLRGDAYYVEAADGRPIFLIPFCGATLIGTTDLKYDGDPGLAVASDDEIAYLLSAVNQVFPQVQVRATDVVLHYAGVRPLPYQPASAKNAAITRRHFLEEHRDAEVPFYSLIGGKLTTCRALAEQAADVVLERLQVQRVASSRERPLPGAEGLPCSDQELTAQMERIARRVTLSVAQVAAVWQLCGSRTEVMLSGQSGGESLAGTSLPVRFIRRVIHDEWVTCLSDLVERRLMLLYHRSLSEQTLEHLARLLGEAGKLPAGSAVEEASAYRRHLAARFGRTVVSISSP